jgi:hypothetical protein
VDNLLSDALESTGAWCWTFLGTQAGRAIGVAYAFRLAVQAIAKLVGDDFRSLPTAKQEHKKVLSSSEGRFQQLWLAGRQRRCYYQIMLLICCLNISLWLWTSSLPLNSDGTIKQLTALQGVLLALTLFSAAIALSLDVVSAWAERRVSDLKRVS